MPKTADCFLDKRLAQSSGGFKQLGPQLLSSACKRSPCLFGDAYLASDKGKLTIMTAQNPHTVGTGYQRLEVDISDGYSANVCHQIISTVMHVLTRTIAPLDIQTSKRAAGMLCKAQHRGAIVGSALAKRAS